MMNPERWQKVNQLYDYALRLDPAERHAFLRAACNSDDELLREVESLLAARGRAAADEEFLNPLALGTPVEVPDPPLIGREISHYRVLALLGRGGMGKVYLAQDSRLGRKVALKLLLTESTRDHQRALRFQQEARAASALNHPNIITVFEIDQLDGAYFIVTEFIEGCTLRERMAATLSPGEIVELAAQMASALSATHAIGITHRDVKPENIMVRHDGYVKVLDFGLAKLSEPLPGTPTGAGSADAATPVLTDPGILMGTPNYMSPEQIRRQPIDARSDIFSLGVVLYEMTTHRQPFSGTTPGEIISAVLRDEPAQVRRFAAAPAELERIIHKALAKERAERYQTSQELLADLRELKLELELAARNRPLNPAAPGIAASHFSTRLLDETESLADATPAPEANREVEPAGGAVPLASQFYILRPTDEEFRAAIARRDSIVLVKGARQVGKTSLLARGLQQARDAGAKIVLTDLQKLNTGDLVSANTFFFAMADLIGDQLELDVLPEEVWNDRRSPSINFERFMRRVVLGKISGPLVWGLDEIDRLFTTSFGSEVFGLFRSWHNERSLDPEGPWQRMTMAIAYATEAHLFITDMNQSPFNVGTRLALEDFNFDQVAELNSRYGSPLKNKPEIERYFRLVGGHPYLVRCGMQEMVTHHRSLAALESIADHDDGPFGDHLRRIAASLEQDAALSEIVRGILEGKPCPTQESFYRLRSAGLVAGDSAQEAMPRCQLYATYLRKRLL
ncbi:MAG: serine/threonine-protein kinase [Acidobacteriota bacterium]